MAEALMLCTGSGNSFGVLCHPVILGGLLLGWAPAVHDWLLQLHFPAVVPPLLLGPHPTWTRPHAEASCADSAGLPLHPPCTVSAVISRCDSSHVYNMQIYLLA